MLFMLLLSCFTLFVRLSCQLVEKVLSDILGCVVPGMLHLQPLEDMTGQCPLPPTVPEHTMSLLQSPRLWSLLLVDIVILKSM